MIRQLFSTECHIEYNIPSFFSFHQMWLRRTWRLRIYVPNRMRYRDAFNQSPEEYNYTNGLKVDRFSEKIGLETAGFRQDS